MLDQAQTRNDTAAEAASDSVVEVADSGALDGEDSEAPATPEVEQTPDGDAAITSEPT